MPISKYYGRFEFICDACGDPIEELDGVVDYPDHPDSLTDGKWLSENIRDPIRFYCRGKCAREGNEKRCEDYWNHDTLKDFVKELAVPLRM